MFVLDLPQTESTLHELEGRCHVDLPWILDGLVRALSARSRKGREVTPYSALVLDRFTCQYFIHVFGVNIFLQKSWRMRKWYVPGPFSSPLQGPGGKVTLQKAIFYPSD